MVTYYTLDTSHAGFGAGCGVASLHFFPVVIFRSSTFRTGMLFRRFLGVSPQVHFGIANLLHAVIAELDMAAISKICKDHIGMGAIFHNTAAMCRKEASSLPRPLTVG